MGDVDLLRPHGRYPTGLPEYRSFAFVQTTPDPQGFLVKRVLQALLTGTTACADLFSFGTGSVDLVNAVLFEMPMPDRKPPVGWLARTSPLVWRQHWGPAL
jgi:hypothetical protein